MVDKLSFFTATPSEGNVSYVEHTNIPYESVGAGLFKGSTLMCIFNLPPPNVTYVNMISVKSNLWLFPSSDQIDSFGDVMPLSPTEINYAEIISVRLLLLIILL